MAMVAALSAVIRAAHRSPAAGPAQAGARGAETGLPVLSDIPAFAFTNIDGRRIDNAALLGHVWVANLMFTRCTTTCPITTAKMSVLRRTIRWPDVRFVSFSIDPEHDTPAVLRAYAARWSADPRWLLLSPPPNEAAAFANAMKMPFERTAMPLEPIMHSSLFFLVDQQGRVRGQYGSLDDTAVRRLMADAAALVVAAGGAPAAQEGAAAGSGPSHGQVLFQALGCAACHTDPRTGPPLAGLAGGQVRLEGGATTVADASYLRRSILAPMEKIVDGYNPLMPAYANYLAPTDVDDLVAYLQSMPASPPKH